MATGFTDPYIKSLTQLGRYTDATTPGLNLNVKSNGRKYWVFRFSYLQSILVGWVYVSLFELGNTDFIQTLASDP